MENLDDIKEMWLNMNERIRNLEDENKKLAERIMRVDYHSVQEKLIRKYIAFIIVEAVMIVFTTLFFIYNPYINEQYRMITLVYWNLFFLMEVMFDGYLMLQIRKIDVCSATLREVAARAASNWRLHKIGIIIGLPFAFGAILLLALAINADEFVIYGMITGGIIGSIIGIVQLLKFRNYYKMMQIDKEKE